MTFFLKPFEDSVITHRFKDLFDDFFENDFGKVGVPKINLSETENDYEITAEIPGLKKEDIKINLKENYITISGERKTEKEEKDKHYYLNETTYGKFSRTIKIPGKIKTENVNATYENGILKLKFEKKDEEKIKEIDVKIK
jgi:HSP20 family protein